MQALAALIREEIRGHGSISFERFMELALYHPAFGYYSGQGETKRTGRGGDFFTSVSVGALFGRLLAAQFLEMWEKLGRPKPFWMVEQGGAEAQLACDILTWCRTEAPEFFEAIRYGFIEPHLSARARQEMTLAASGMREKMTWFPSLKEAAGRPLCGVFFSNELVDAFPVRAIARRNGEWLERKVGLEGEDSLVWIEEKIQDHALAEAVSRIAPPGVEDYVTEINLRARAWMSEVGRVIERGYGVTIDYGFPSSLYYAPFRGNGTLTAYQKHQRTGDVLLHPGEQDLTAHVDFTALAQAGAEAGLEAIGFLDQQHFLMGIAHDELSEVASRRVGIGETLRAWNTLTHPSYLGSRFQVLLQAKNAPGDLAGLRYGAPDGLKALR